MSLSIVNLLHTLINNKKQKYKKEAKLQVLDLHLFCKQLEITLD